MKSRIAQFIYSTFHIIGSVLGFLYFAIGTVMLVTLVGFCIYQLFTSCNFKLWLSIIGISAGVCSVLAGLEWLYHWSERNCGWWKEDKED